MCGLQQRQLERLVVSAHPLAVEVALVQRCWWVPAEDAILEEFSGRPPLEGRLVVAIDGRSIGIEVRDLALLVDDSEDDIAQRFQRNRRPLADDADPVFRRVVPRSIASGMDDEIDTAGVVDPPLQRRREVEPPSRRSA
jgi:hypothetical protein